MLIIKTKLNAAFIRSPRPVCYRNKDTDNYVGEPIMWHNPTISKLVRQICVQYLRSTLHPECHVPPPQTGTGVAMVLRQ